MADDEIPPDPAESVTITGLLKAFESDGFTSQFAARERGQVECLACHHIVDAATLEVDRFRRLEGASDPDDMVAVVALTCRRCGARGTLVLGYGPASSDEDSSVLGGLEETPPPDPDVVI